MRLCLVISALTAGGAERVMSLLANEWAALGHDVHIITTHDGGCPPHYQMDERVRLHSVDHGFGGLARQLGVIKSLHHAVDGLQPAVVVSFLNYTNIITLLACRGLATPVIVSERLDPRVIGIGPLWSALRRITYRWAACLVAQTQTAARLYEPLAPGRTRVIPNPVVVPTCAESIVESWPEPDRPTIIMVGRLQPQKGYEVALRAMVTVHETQPDWRLVVVGEGPLLGELESLRDKLGLREDVLFAGRVSEPVTWLRRARIFLLSSHSEGFPNALCEAMAAGLPCLATDCPSGPAEIINHGVDGLLVPPNNPQAMANSLIDMILDVSLRTRLASAAPGVADRFTMESVRTQWERVIADVTKASGAPG